ncbi:MAG: ISNCY family transposase [Acidobacteriota bacterium]
MRRTEWLRETRAMRFEEAFYGWRAKRLTQEEAALLLGVCGRTFRRYVDRFEAEGLDGLSDRRLTQASHRRAPVDEVMRLTEAYRARHEGWAAQHFYSWYRRDGGGRSYTWVKTKLQEAGLMKRAKGRGKHRKRRERMPWTGMMLHQDGSTHEWVPGKKWDLIVTLDDATNEQYSAFFVEQEGTASSFRGVQEVIEARGLFASIYTDRGSHYWNMEKAGGKVDRQNLTQFGRAMEQLGIQMIPAYSPQARGRSERMFRTHQGRLPKELLAAGITEMEAANQYLREVYLPAFNAEFARPAAEEGSAFVSCQGRELADVLCEHHKRVVGNDNCVSFENKKLQIPKDTVRFHYARVGVRVHRYPDGHLAIFHGPRCLARYDAEGVLADPENPGALPSKALGLSHSGHPDDRKDSAALLSKALGLSHSGHPDDGEGSAAQKRERPGAKPGPSVLAPASALGSLPSVALSSGRARKPYPKKPALSNGNP